MCLGNAVARNRIDAAGGIGHVSKQRVRNTRSDEIVR